MAPTPPLHVRELKKFGESLAFTVASLLLTFLAFVLVILLQSMGRELPEGEMERLLTLAAIFTAVVFVCAIFIQLPLLRLAARARISVMGSIAVGALLGFVPVSVLALLLHERNDPRRLAAHVTFWAHASRSLLVEAVICVAAGATIGWLAAKSTAKKAASQQQ